MSGIDILNKDMLRDKGLLCKIKSETQEAYL